MSNSKKSFYDYSNEIDILNTRAKSLISDLSLSPVSKALLPQISDSLSTKTLTELETLAFHMTQRPFSHKL